MTIYQAVMGLDELLNIEFSSQEIPAPLFEERLARLQWELAILSEA